jgi:hypothetical protein
MSYKIKSFLATRRFVSVHIQDMSCDNFLLHCSMYSCKIGEYTMAVSEERLGKHVPAEMSTHVTVDLLLETGCFLCGSC